MLISSDISKKGNNLHDPQSPKKSMEDNSSAYDKAPPILITIKKKAKGWLVYIYCLLDRESLVSCDKVSIAQNPFIRDMLCCEV